MAVNINGTSGISGVDGSAGTPALQGSDSNTGISFGNDVVDIVTGGTARTRVTAGGGTITTGTTILFGGNVSTAASPRSIGLGANEIAWTASGSGGTNLFLNACDENGDNGSSYSMYFRGLASGGSAGATLSVTQFDSTAFLAKGVYNTTTTSGANVQVHTDGRVRRSTSSARYKRDIETLSDSYADALLECRPVWYRSIANGDTEHPDWGYWGFIAEEVAEIDPRLVFWKTHEYITDVDGNTTAEELDEPLAEGVQYDRFVPHLVNLIKRQKEQLETQAATIAALDARLTALEGGANQ